jgi:hypothetical protein
MALLSAADDMESHTQQLVFSSIVRGYRDVIGQRGWRALWFILAGASGAGLAEEPSLAYLLSNLRANHQALVAARQDFSRSQWQSTQAADYQAFLTHLSERVAASCRALQDAHYRFQADDPPCPRQAAQPASIAAVPAEPMSPTSAERTATLDAQLNASLSEFDERLRQEQARISAALPTAGGNAADGAATTTAGAWTEPQASAVTGSRQGRHGDAKSAITKAATQKAMHNREDVVERQVREAAEHETDPQLRRKLWDEYEKLRAQNTGFEH